MKDYSMKSHDRRKHQKWLNAYCKHINKTIADDPLWLGRFVVEQKSTSMDWFDDNSGGLLYCRLQFRDKKTGQTKDWYTDCLEVRYRMFFEMNDFIVEDCRVWEKDDPTNNRIDFRRVK